MASLHQKRPSISNWFSSLRRQPKNKKQSSISNSIYGGNEKKYQRSCIDLNSAVQQSSTFYVPPEISKSKTSFQTNSTASRIGSTETILQDDSNYYDNADDDRRRLVSSGKRVSQLCSRCCCSISSATSRATTPSPKSTRSIKSTKSKSISESKSKSPAAPRSPSISPYTTLASYEIKTPPPPSPAAQSLSPEPPVTYSSETVISNDVSRDVSYQQLPCASEPEYVIIQKRSEMKRRMTTTTTRTLIVSRPVELILNENGEIVSRRPTHLPPMKTRCNSFDCVLDDETTTTTNDDVESSRNDDSNSSCNSHSPCSPTTHSAASIILSSDGDEFRFIDDSSTSQSETERISQNSTHQGRRLTENEPPILRNTRRSNPHNNISQTNHNNNNNNYSHINNNDHKTSPDNLCDACKRVMEMNRKNIAHSAATITGKKQIKDELSEVLSEMEALDVPEDCKHSNKDKQLSIGRKKFNMDPKKGVEYLVENRLLRHDPQDVAHFLYKGEGLNKTAIGDYLGEKIDFNEDVLKAFVALHDFTNLILVQALRQFLWSFRLPGEAQKIDRMMECFAQRYCQLNPDIFTNTDTCYVLSFAIIMLNTSLHNPSVKDKPTVEQFISMNRGINNGGDLPRELLESLYESIRTEPFKIPQDDGNDLMHTFFNPDKEGWLWKQGGRYKSWKRRWFILNDNCLYYFEFTTDKEPRGIIPLENISVREIHDRSKPHCFELFATGGADIIKACKTDSEGKVVEGKHSVYRMSAATEEDQQEWIKRLTQSISHNPFYDILVQRKKKALSKS